MDPLQQLYELADMQLKPSLQEPEEVLATPQRGEYLHPVIKQRDEVDGHRDTGAEAEDAHELVHGAVDLADPDSKAKLAATLSRVQDGKDKKGVMLDKKAEMPSLLAQDVMKDEVTDDVTAQDLKTPIDQQVPDDEQVSEQPLDAQEEYDYNLDVAFLQKYGRA